jgi:hypothetical protein
MDDQRLPESPSTGEGRNPHRQREAMDKAVGYVASVLGVLVVVASVPTPSKTGVMALTGLLFGMFGYLLGSRLLGSLTVLCSTAAMLVWFLT